MIPVRVTEMIALSEAIDWMVRMIKAVDLTLGVAVRVTGWDGSNAMAEVGMVPRRGMTCAAWMMRPVRERELDTKRYNQTENP